MTVVARQEHVRLAQLDRAFGYGPKGREFESSNARRLKMGENLEFIKVLAFFVYTIILFLGVTLYYTKELTFVPFGFEYLLRYQFV